MICNIIELKKRKENMIKCHKEHIMLPLMLLGAVAFMPALAADAKNGISTKILKR